MVARDDTSLLKAIAERRDETAFSDLYDRYQKSAFSLAFRILCNRTLAEDAVQEAMFSIWHSAKNFEPRDGVSNWILRIVANKSINLGRGRKRSLKREESIAVDRNIAGASTSLEIEKDEVVAVLRNHIDQLPELESQLLACCYGASLSHQEIAELFEMSRSRVSERIQVALGHLRSSLTKAGVAAVVPLVSAEYLFEAMTTGHECPPGMVLRAVRRITAKKSARFHSRRAVVSTGASGAPRVVAMIAALSTLVGFWLFQPVNRVAAPVAKPESVAVKVAVPMVNYHWAFANGAPPEIAVRAGSWTFNPRTRRMEIDGIAVLQLPEVPPQRTLLLQVKAGYRNGEGAGVGSIRNEGGKLLRHRLWVNNRTDVSPGQNNVYKEFIVGSFVYTFLNDKIAGISEYETPQTATHNVLIIKNLDAADLILKEVPDSELPPEVRDGAGALIARLKWPVSEVADEAISNFNPPNR